MKKITYQLFPFFLCLIFMFPIVKESFSSFFIILLGINTLIYKILSKNYSVIKPKTLLLTIPFWIILVPSVFSKNYALSFLHVNHGLYFLIIPILFSMVPCEFFSKNKINLYFNVLKNTCLLIAIIYVVSFFINIPLWRLNFKDGSVFREYVYNYFKLFVIHPSYYTTILILVCAHSFDLVLKEKKYWQLVYVFSFLAINFLLLTKLNIVIMVITLIFMLLFRSLLNFKQKIIGILMSVICVFLFILFVPGLKNRFVETYQGFNSKPEALAFNSTNIRKAIFDCSIEISKENLTHGVGFENLQANLNNCYKANYDSSFYQKTSYMTHNYYFYILLSTGMIGFLVYLFYLINIINISLKSNNFLFKVMLFNALTICFIEDYFYRQFGLLYFSIMVMVFLRHHQNMQEINK